MGVARSRTARALSRGLDRVCRAAWARRGCGAVWEPNTSCAAGLALPLVGWFSAARLLRSSRRRPSGGGRNTLAAYSVASVLLLLVAGVIPGALLFLASYRLHAWSYIKNSQLIVAHRLADRYDRLNETYRLGGAENPRSPAWSSTGVVSDRDIYVDFLYNTSVNRLQRGRQDAFLCSRARADDVVTRHDASQRRHAARAARRPPAVLLRSFGRVAGAAARSVGR